MAIFAAVTIFAVGFAVGAGWMLFLCLPHLDK